MAAALTRAARTAAYGALHLGGAAGLARRLQRRRLLVVCYHGVRPGGDDGHRPHWLLLPLPELERQVAFLARHYRVLPLDEALERLWSGRLTEPTACITFDDGYRNNRTLAEPVLRAHSAPATIYLATGLVGARRLLWTTELPLRVAASPHAAVPLGGASRGDTPLGDAAERARLASALVAELKLLPAEDRRRRLDALYAALGGGEPAVPAGHEFLSWEDVREMDDGGLVTFGGHTVEHELVSRLDDARLRAEIVGSVRRVADVVRRPSRTFAYPNGRRVDVDARAERIVREAGCIGAVTTVQGLNDRSTPPTLLRRVVVGGDMRYSDFVVRCAGLVGAGRDE